MTEEEIKICHSLEKLSKKGDCIYYDVEVYSLGTAEYCKYYQKLLYNLKDKNCPHRPIYSDEV